MVHFDILYRFELLGGVPLWMKALQSGTLELQVAEAMLLTASCHLSLADWLELAGDAARWSRQVHASALEQKAATRHGMLLHVVMPVVHPLCSCGRRSNEVENANIPGSASNAAKEVDWL